MSVAEFSVSELSELSEKRRSLLLAVCHDAAAAMISVSPRHLHNEVKAGRIKRKMSRSKPLYEITELQRYLSDK